MIGAVGDAKPKSSGVGGIKKEGNKKVCAEEGGGSDSVNVLHIREHAKGQG